jgi:hypothetical protein
MRGKIGKRTKFGMRLIGQEKEENFFTLPLLPLLHILDI